nr:phosphoinositide 3-kinase adapter protein 1 isoform X2 [Misgurnus anguillicaudatus]
MWNQSTPIRFHICPCVSLHSSSKAHPGQSTMCEVLIVHTCEASEWADYLKQILTASCSFLEDSIVLYNINENILLKSQELFGSCKCVIPLLSAEFMDMQNDPETLDTFQDFFQPPHKVVAFLCGLSETEISQGYFEHWQYWRKLSSDDEPSVYVSTVLECINDGSIDANCQEIDNIQLEEQRDPQDDKDDFIFPDIPEDLPLPDEIEQPNDDDVGPTEPASLNVSEPSLEDQPCLTIQPDRVLRGTCVNIYIIMMKNLDDEDGLEVEFSSEHSTAKRMPATLVNKCIVTVQSPDMPAGIVSVTLYKNDSAVCSSTVTYYTEMEEICTYLEKMSDPMQFMCQAFNITSNVPESLDILLADCLKKRMPLCGLEMFSQVEQENTTGNSRDVELPTLLHFSAKYGLKKLTSLLMRCPGALQAYSLMNKDGDYPNKLAEKSGFSDLKQFMDEYVETVDMVKVHMEESQNSPGDEIYEDMLTKSQEFITGFDNEDIYECMIKLNPEMNLYEDLESVMEDANPEERMLRKFFEAKPGKCLQSEPTVNNGELPDMDGEYHDMGVDPEVYGELEEEEDPYNPCFPDDVYDVVEPHPNVPELLNRPPAPIPRPVHKQNPEENATYISKVFSLNKDPPLYSVSKRPEKDICTAPARLVRDREMSSDYDPYAGMKTPGQRQLISLQERVKVGELTVEEAVHEFKAWQFDQDGRSHSLRYQQENLQKLRDSITRRCRTKGTTELMITAPMQTNVHWVPNKNINCSVYESTPRSITQPPPVSRPLQRGSWQTGSTSSTSSSSSHRLSIQSTVSSSSGAEGEFEEPPDIPLPPRPTRPAADSPPVLPPPRVPPRLPERNAESALHERYVSNPSRAIPPVTPQRPMPPPPIPRRTW